MIGGRERGRQSQALSPVSDLRQRDGGFVFSGG